GGEPAIRGGRRYIIGGNIGKNKITPNENAIDDYVYCFEKLFDYVDYFVVNVSSPNTPGLRELQEKEPLKKILNRLMAMNARPPSPKGQPQVATEGQRPGYPSGRGGKPILLKIAPDLTNEQLDDIIEIVSETKIDGVVATNTTISRENLRTPNSRLQSLGSGGLSGKPLTKRSTEVVKYLHEKSHGSFPIIASGGIHSAEDAVEKLKAGASLVQLYTGFIYEGPGLIRSIVRRLMTEDRRNTNTVN
ncbi:MAG: quinone-dependent dihydroorotate dehydrogenase, partial [Bacteroidetes bacterium]